MDGLSERRRVFFSAMRRGRTKDKQAEVHELRHYPVRF